MTRLTILIAALVLTGCGGEIEVTIVCHDVDDEYGSEPRKIKAVVTPAHGPPYKVMSQHGQVWIMADGSVAPKSAWGALDEAFSRLERELGMEFLASNYADDFETWCDKSFEELSGDEPLDGVWARYGDVYDDEFSYWVRAGDLPTCIEGQDPTGANGGSVFPCRAARAERSIEDE